MTREKQRYLPSHKRVTTPPPMRLTARDTNIIKAVYSLGILTSEHIEALFFSSRNSETRSRRSACQRRLQLLFHHQFLRRLNRPLIPGEGRAPFVYALDEAGVCLVARELGVHQSELAHKGTGEGQSQLFIEHSLATNDFRVALLLLARSKNWRITNWVSDTTFKTKAYRKRVPFYSQGSRLVRVFPDGYFRLSFGVGKSAHYFLEVDRGTMSNERFKRKMEAYASFRSSGLSESSFATKNFRVLTVTTSRKRLENLKRVTAGVGDESHFWFTTEEHIDIWQPEVLLKPIWAVASHRTLFAAFSQ